MLLTHYDTEILPVFSILAVDQKSYKGSFLFIIHAQSFRINVLQNSSKFVSRIYT